MARWFSFSGFFPSRKIAAPRPFPTGPTDAVGATQFLRHVPASCEDAKKGEGNFRAETSPNSFFARGRTNFSSSYYVGSSSSSFRHKNWPNKPYERRSPTHPPKPFRKKREIGIGKWAMNEWTPKGYSLYHLDFPRLSIADSLQCT